MLKLVQWDEILDGDIDQCWDRFKNVLQEAINQFVSDRKEKPGRYKKSIWMTYAALRSVRKKHALYRRYKDSSHPKYIEAANEPKKQTW